MAIDPCWQTETADRTPATRRADLSINKERQTDRHTPRQKDMEPGSVLPMLSRRLRPGHITSAWMEFVSQLLSRVLTLSLHSTGIYPCLSLCWETSVNMCNAHQEQNWSPYHVGVTYQCQYISTCTEKQAEWQEEHTEESIISLNNLVIL